MRVVVSCEHATHRVPRELRSRLSPRVLASHRGWDPGAASVAKLLAKRLDAPLFMAEVSRLVIDLNRSLHHRGLTAISALTKEQRQALVERYYLPFRARVRQALGVGPALHLSVHSFTPVLGGQRRRGEIGLLYDPGRARERAWVAALMAELSERRPELHLRRNYPYRGVADGHTTALRKALSPARYLGIEIELNQALLGPGFGGVARDLVTAIASVLDQRRGQPRRY